MMLARLTVDGIREFAAYLLRMQNDPSEAPPKSILSHENFADLTGLGCEMPNVVPATRYDLGSALVEVLAQYDQVTIQHDAGLWAWLALFYFDSLCPVDKLGLRKVARQDNYILSARRNDFNRHAVRTTYILVKQHGELVQYMLSGPMAVRGEFTEQLTGRPYFMNCPGIIHAAHTLYSDVNRGTFKRGAASKRSGTVRRFGLVVRQLELTHDVIALSGPEIVALLPKEFDAFRD